MRHRIAAVLFAVAAVSMPAFAIPAFAQPGSLTMANTAGVVIETLDTGPLAPALASRLEEGQP